MLSAEVRPAGLMDLSAFFRSSDAMIVPQSTQVGHQALGLAGTGATAELSGSCVSSATIVAPFGSPTTPASLFSTCQSDFSYPTGADIDSCQGFWSSRGRPTDPDQQRGVVLLDLSQVPPMGTDGQVPIASPGITKSPGFGAEDIVIRENSLFSICPQGGQPGPSAIHALSTWPLGNGEIICPTVRRSGVAPAICGGGICGTCGLINTTEPFAIDVVRPGMPEHFGLPNDAIFSGRELGLASIRRGRTPSPCYEQPPPTVVTLATLTGVTRVWGLALGDFKDPGFFAVYFVAESTTGSRDVRRLVRSADGSFSNECFASLPAGNLARSAAFDPISGDLFVSEDVALAQNNADQARIWRIGKARTVRLFGRRFNKPNGIAFHPSGVMLVAEESSVEPTKGNVLVVGGWSNLFMRGDANGDGAVDISDPIVISNWLNQGGAAPACLDGADADDDSRVLQGDADYILSFLFSGGPPPPAPGPFQEGRDPTADLLDCITSQCPGCPIQ